MLIIKTNVEEIRLKTLLSAPQEYAGRRPLNGLRGALAVYWQPVQPGRGPTWNY